MVVQLQFLSPQILEAFIVHKCVNNLLGRIGKRSTKFNENRTKEGLRIGVRTSGKTNSPPG